MDSTISKYSLSKSEIQVLRARRQKRIEYLKERAAEISLSPLPTGQSYKAVAISVDASNVPVETDVFDGMVVRCADSDGEEYFQHFVLTEAAEASISELLDDFFEEVPVLQLLLDIMGVHSWQEFAPFKEAQSPERFISEMLEWGVLAKLASDCRRAILLKDGLLRTKFIKPNLSALQNLRIHFAESCRQHDNFVAGIAKTSRVFEQNKLLLQFVDGFTSRRAFFLRIPQDLLEESYGWRYIAEDVKWGELFFVRLMPHPDARIMTVEVPDFIESKLKDILKILAALPLRNVPDRFRGFPDPLARAHENATLRRNVGAAIARRIMRNE